VSVAKTASHANSSHSAPSWIRRVHRGPPNLSTNQPSGSIVQSSVLNTRYLRHSELSQNSLLLNDTSTFKRLHMNHLSRIILLTCRLHFPVNFYQQLTKRCQISCSILALYPEQWNRRNHNTQGIRSLRHCSVCVVLGWHCHPLTLWTRNRNFKISLLNSYLEIQGLPCLHIFLQIERSAATKIFVLAVAITNCTFPKFAFRVVHWRYLWSNYQGLTAVAFLTICSANIVYKSPEIYSEMFVVPVGTLFAFSSIRANFPGAPSGFGMNPINFLKCTESEAVDRSIYRLVFQTK